MQAKQIVIGVTALAIPLSVYLATPHSEIKEKRITIGNTDIYAEVMKTPEEWQKGLSGRESLKENHGMLFIFKKDDRYGIWMKDMHFAIDIIWINAKKEIVHIAHSVPPDSYPKIFKSPVPARYILEVPAGYNKKNGIEIGDAVTWE